VSASFKTAARNKPFGFWRWLSIGDDHICS